MRKPYRQTGNILIGALPERDRALLAPALERVPLVKGAWLVEADRPIEHVYFPESGIASVLSGTREGDRQEMAVIGREGIVGAPAVLRAGQSSNGVMVQVDSATALRLPTAALLDMTARSEPLTTLLMRFVHTLLVQMGNNAVSNTSDRLDARLARWLVMCHDRESGDTLALTHELMALMIGVHRSAVTHALHELEGAGLVRAQRGLVAVLDRPGLQAAAGAGYGAPEAEYRRLIAPFGKG